MKKILSFLMAFLIVLPAISVFSPQVKADTDNVVFQDDFEAYAVGSFPSAGGWELVWNGKGTEYQIVTDTVSTSPTRSFQLWGQPGWSANVQKLFTSSSEVIGYEAYVRTDSHTGAFAKIAQVCFWNREALTWGKRFAQVNFYDNGEVYTEPVSGSGGIFLQNYEANRWYKVRVVIDKIAETYNVWIDDVLVAEDISIWDTNQIEAIELESGHAGIKAYFDDVKVFESAPSETTLTINAFDESGFPPASANGFTSIAEVKVTIYDVNDNLIVSGETGDDGSITFNLNPGTYRIEYGGCLARPVSSPKTDLKYYHPTLPTSTHVEVTSGSNEIDVHVAWLLWHEYQWGSDGGSPFELNYLDLDSNTAEYEYSISVSPGQTIQAEASFWELETVNVPVWYASMFGEWQPTAALADLASGTASPSSHNLHTIPFTFTAPTTPGTYHVRLNGVLDYDWPNSYYTGCHPHTGLGRDMCPAIISDIDIDTETKDVTGTYGLGTITVVSEAEPDFEISVLPRTQSIDLAQQACYEIIITSMNGFNSEVELTYKITPLADMGLSLDHTRVTPPSNGEARATLYVQTYPNTPTQTYTIRIVAAGGGISRVDEASLKVYLVKGVETVVTINEFKVENNQRTNLNLLFSIQQNLIIPVEYGIKQIDGVDVYMPTEFYAVQNVIVVSGNEGNYRMYGGYNIWKSDWTTRELIARNLDRVFYDYKEMVVLRTAIYPAIVGYELQINNDFLHDVAFNLPCVGYIDTTMDDIVIVGPIASVPSVTFIPPTSGHIDAYFLLNSNDWVNAIMKSIDASGITYETSKGLTFYDEYTAPTEDSVGDFDANPSPSSDHQGFLIEPDYESPPVTPPAVPTPSPHQFSLAMMVRCPVNMSLFDSIGRHVGYNSLTGKFDAEIPNIVYYFGEDEEWVAIINPTNDTYSIILVGTATGNYTLTIEYITAEQTVTQTFNGTISEQEKQYYSALLTETGEMTAISWEYVFEDIKRGTMLKISTDDHYFQFVAPDKTFSVKYDPDMFVYKHFVFICYKDDELKLITLAVDTRLDFCFAYVKDMQTSQRYVLIDKPGTE